MTYQTFDIAKSVYPDLDEGKGETVRDEVNNSRDTFW